MITYSIPKGKIPYRKQATLYVVFVSTKNNTNATVDIVLDDRVLLTQPLSTVVTKFTYKFDDSPGEHEFCIRLCGEPADSMLHIQDLRIEGLNMRNTMEDSGICIMNNIAHIPSEYMGQTGYQLLKFTTPIYPWLLENERKHDYYL